MDKLATVFIFLVLVGMVAAALRAVLRHTVVPPGWQGVEYRHGQVQRVLPPGRYRQPLFGPHQLQRVFMQEFPLYGMTVSVMTADQFAFRLTLVPLCRVTDPAMLLETQTIEPEEPQSYAGALAPHVAAAALDRIAGLTLDAFLARRDEVVAAIHDAVAGAVPGLTVTRLLLTEVTMPPEIRRMFTEVERARREGLAALERARAEQASLRALANAARALASNPGLAQLRLLQTMESAKGAKTFVLGPQAVASDDVPSAPTAAD